jgi:hypothetical protein
MIIRRDRLTVIQTLTVKCLERYGLAQRDTIEFDPKGCDSESGGRNFPIEGLVMKHVNGELSETSKYVRCQCFMAYYDSRLDVRDNKLRIGLVVRNTNVCGSAN